MNKVFIIYMSLEITMQLIRYFSSVLNEIISTQWDDKNLKYYADFGKDGK